MSPHLRFLGSRGWDLGPFLSTCLGSCLLVGQGEDLGPRMEMANILSTEEVAGNFLSTLKP